MSASEAVGGHALFMKTGFLLSCTARARLTRVRRETLGNIPRRHRAHVDEKDGGKVDLSLYLPHRFGRGVAVRSLIYLYLSSAVTLQRCAWAYRIGDACC